MRVWKRREKRAVIHRSEWYRSETRNITSCVLCVVYRTRRSIILSLNRNCHKILIKNAILKSNENNNKKPENGYRIRAISSSHRQCWECFWRRKCPTYLHFFLHFFCSFFLSFSYFSFLQWYAVDRIHLHTQNISKMIYRMLRFTIYGSFGICRFPNIDTLSRIICCSPLALNCGGLGLYFYSHDCELTCNARLCGWFVFVWVCVSVGIWFREISIFKTNMHTTGNNHIAHP